MTQRTELIDDSRARTLLVFADKSAESETSERERESAIDFCVHVSYVPHVYKPPQALKMSQYSKHSFSRNKRPSKK